MNNYSFEMETQKGAKEVFALLLDIKTWWSGIYEETIAGQSSTINDEFSFSAGGGMHFTRQKLLEQVPYRTIVWEVIESNLSFLDNPKEWEHTKLRFDITETAATTTIITFTHEGLTPAIECYDQCSTAWSQYFTNFQKMLR